MATYKFENEKVDVSPTIRSSIPGAIDVIGSRGMEQAVVTPNAPTGVISGTQGVNTNPGLISDTSAYRADASKLGQKIVDSSLKTPQVTFPTSLDVTPPASGGASKYDDVNDLYSKRQTELDKRRQAEIEQINKDFDIAQQNTETLQKNETGTTSRNLIMMGGGLGGSASEQGALLSLERSHRDEINALVAKRQNAIQMAQNAYSDKQFALAQQQASAVKAIDDDIYKRQQDFVENSLKIMAEQRAQQDSLFQEKKYQSERETAARTFAITNNITKPFYRVGNAAIDAATGEKVDLREYQRRTGQQVGLPPEYTDFSFLQTDIETPEMRKMSFEERKMAQEQKNWEATYGLQLDQFSLAKQKFLLEAEEAAKVSVKASWQDINGDGFKELVNDQTGEVIKDPANTPGLKKPASELQVKALQSAQSLLDKVKNGTGTSAIGGSRIFGFQHIPGTPQADLVAEFNALKSQLSLDAVKFLKGQGSITDGERELLSNAVSKLNLSQSEGEFKKTLEELVTGLSGKSQETMSLQQYITKNPDKFTQAKELHDKGYKDDEILQIFGIPLTKEGSGSQNAQVKSFTKSIEPAKPIQFDDSKYTTLQKKNLEYAPDIQVSNVKIGAGAAVKNNNPGNLRNTDGSWMKFSTPEEGFRGLMGYLERAKTGNHTAYNPGQTLYQFFAKYAPAADSNNPKAYAEAVAKRMGISPNTTISKLDTLAFAREIARHESNTSVG